MNNTNGTNYAWFRVYGQPDQQFVDWFMGDNYIARTREIGSRFGDAVQARYDYADGRAAVIQVREGEVSLSHGTPSEKGGRCQADFVLKGTETTESFRVPDELTASLVRQLMTVQPQS